ncbi:MAG: SIR2 family protein [Saprospiraceae bacterium]|nr:SIR2 family protein [Saprospiraceae bacterium]
MGLFKQILDFLFSTKKEENIVSFLIGSGFSVADGLPLVRDINHRLSSIKENEIMIHSEMSALFLNGQENLNEWQRKEERIFIQEFLEFYCSEIVDGQDTFHYEDFFDFYSDFLRKGYEEDDSPINLFCESFRKKHEGSLNVVDNYSLISNFHNTFNQLLGSLLQKAKYYEDITPFNYYPYDSFILFLKDLIEDNQIKVHTLNHDLLFERICCVPPLWQEFSDGYYENGSPYYSYVEVPQPIKKKYRVRLKYFQNKFDKKICLYKLHGSVDTYQFNIADQHKDLTRVKSDYGIEHRFVKEVRDPETGEYLYINGWQNSYPDFLSGTTTKMLSYGNEFYEIIFNYFKNNLINSKLLIVIGYGFADAGINQYLEDFFLKAGKKMIVINPSKPKSDLMNYDVEVLEKKMQHVTYEEFSSMIK